MSQHDLTISTADANTGATYRAEVNNALQALASCQSGATAPAVTFPYMWWANTSDGWLYQRNGANTAWLRRFDLTADFTPAPQGADSPGGKLFLAKMYGGL